MSFIWPWSGWRESKPPKWPRFRRPTRTTASRSRDSAGLREHRRSLDCAEKRYGLYWSRMRYCCAFAIAIWAMPHPAMAQIRFEEIAKKAGLDFRLKNAASGQFHQVELMPGGVAAFDYDNDGCMDLFFTNGATIPGLQKSGPERSGSQRRS